MSFYVVIRGPLGCGKSTISEKLSKILKAKYFAVDIILDEYDLTKDKEAGYISQKSFIKANEIIAPEAKRILEKGKPIVFDGNFYWKSQIDDLIKRLNFQHHVFTLKAPLKLCIERNQKRRKTYDDDSVIAVYKKTTEFDCGIIIDMNRTLDECIKDILSYVSKLY